MYVNDTIKSYYPTIEEDFNNVIQYRIIFVVIRLMAREL